VPELTALVTPLSQLLSGLFDAGTAGSILFILSSCLFLTGFVQKRSSSSFSVGQRKVSNKEGSRTYGAEQAGQASPGETTQPPKRVRRENQRAHESLEQTFKRLHRKYGRDQFMITAHQVDEEANGIQHQAMAKNVPVKYMTIGQAAEEFQIANATLVEWVADGWLQNVTKVQHPAKPESGIVLVEPREVAKLKEKVGIGEEAAEPTLITLVDAAKKYDVPYWTVRAWYHRGHLSEKGREVFGTHGGGKILVDENEVIRLMNRRTPKRKSPSKPAE
jgi:hypothetical protein